MAKLCCWINSVLIVIVLLLTVNILVGHNLGGFGENTAKISQNTGYYVGGQKSQGKFRDMTSLS
jgi:hypothetical protein